MQLSAVQCVEEVLSHHMDYGSVLLRADIAGRSIATDDCNNDNKSSVCFYYVRIEFMFEALSSKNELLVR